jgi:hypothetical protein
MKIDGGTFDEGWYDKQLEEKRQKRRDELAAMPPDDAFREEVLDRLEVALKLDPWGKPRPAREQAEAIFETILSIISR